MVDETKKRPKTSKNRHYSFCILTHTNVDNTGPQKKKNRNALSTKVTVSYVFWGGESVSGIRFYP